VTEHEQRCEAGNIAIHCCVGYPWEGLTAWQVMCYGEPLPAEVIHTATATGLEPHALHHHVEGVHGNEPHDPGYPAAVAAAARCMLAGGCEIS
jgi:hypothetical protein